MENEKYQDRNGVINPNEEDAKKIKNYSREERNEMLKNIAQKRKTVLDKLSKN